MGCVFENEPAFDVMAEDVVWRQDKAPHLEGTFKATVLHGEAQADNAGHPSGRMSADPWTVICASNPAECVGMVEGDTLTTEDGTILSVQQVTRDAALGWVIKCTANARASK